MFLSLEHFYFCHCFGFRVSDFEFLTEKTEVFGQRLNRLRPREIASHFTGRAGQAELAEAQSFLRRLNDGQALEVLLWEANQSHVPGVWIVYIRLQ